MTRRNITLIAITILVVGILGVVGCTKEVEVEVTKEVPMTLPVLAEKIKSGEIDVGTEDGLAFDQRYHNIHNVVLGLGCSSCHIAEVDATNEVFSAWNVSPQAPGPVDRRGCLGCHSVGGPATAFYGSES